MLLSHQLERFLLRPARFSVAEHDPQGYECFDESHLIRWRERNGNTWEWEDDDVILTTNANGTVAFMSGSYPRSGNSRVSDIEFVIVSVTLPNGLAWDGDETTIHADAP